MNVCAEGQGFGATANPIYNGIGLKGHPGQDWSCGWSTPISSRYAGIAYKVFAFHDSPNADGFTEVDIIVDDGFECFEWQVGHLDPSIAHGTQVNVGDIIGTEANHGPGSNPATDGLFLLVGVGRLDIAPRTRLFLHQQLAAGAASRKPPYGRDYHLEHAVTCGITGWHRAVVRGVRPVEFPRLAWARAADALVSRAR